MQTKSIKHLFLNHSFGATTYDIPEAIPIQDIQHEAQTREYHTSDGVIQGSQLNDTVHILRADNSFTDGIRDALCIIKPKVQYEDEEELAGILYLCPFGRNLEPFDLI